MLLKALLKRHKLKLGFTLLLLLTEAFTTLLFPLVIGIAIDDAVNNSYTGALQLGTLGLTVLVIGIGRRVFDSRFYAQLYQEISPEVISKINGKIPSIKSARLTMVRELVEFLENSLPELITAAITLVGTIAIIITLDIRVFLGSLITTAAVFLIYRMSRKKTIRLNRSSNDELEKQVEIISKKDEDELKLHLKRMMKWNIKLSDLEAINFSLSWSFMMCFLVVTIILSAYNEAIGYGAILSLIMYVFQYIENVVSLPFFYQNWLRLKEINERIETG